MRKVKTRRRYFPKTYVLPYQLGVYLAVNAVSDVCLVVDGPNCVLPKADLLAGSHDLYSGLFSPSGGHRLVASMGGPLPQADDPERGLSSLLRAASSCGDYRAVLVTGLPFMNLAGADYEGMAAGVRGGVPVRHVPALSAEEDWLDGYDRTLEALVSALPARKGPLKKRVAAVTGYMHDRGEGDHRANISELKRLLRLAGMERAVFLPDGGSFASWKKALSAGVVVSLPYGRRAAARLAGLTGARLVETGLPMGLTGTTAWLSGIRKAAGLGNALPKELASEERRAAAAISPALAALEHSAIGFAGDPYLFAALEGLARDLGMSAGTAFLNCRSRRLGSSRPELLMFSPPVEEAAAALRKLGEYRRPVLAVCDHFARAERLFGGIPAVEFGFPSYSRHCLHEEPFLGYAGAKAFAGRLLNAALAASGEAG